MRHTREQRRQLERDNERYPATLVQVPRADWTPARLPDRIIEVWRSREYFVQVYEEADGILRMTVCRTTNNGDDWSAEISWDALQSLKHECGRGDRDAVEVYPSDRDVVNVANMRHLWILPEPLPFAWRRVQ